MHAYVHARRLDRHAMVLCIGGGAVQDAVGYAAATAHRGLRVLRMPTTVLSQNDGGVGVKNGINAFEAKNFLGTFAPPWAVLNDARFLSTLEARDLRAGMAEAVKVALIRDADFFNWIEGNAKSLAAFEPVTLSELIRRCAHRHLEHIAGGGDPFETGTARPLDYGHWAAHRLEVLSCHDLRHGEAVAIGMALDARYATQIGQLSEPDLTRICVLLESLGLSLWHPALGPDVLRGLQDFREHLGGELTIPLLTEIGAYRDAHEMDEDNILEAIAWLESRCT